MQPELQFAGNYYFSKRFGFHTLTIVSQPPYYYHLYLVIPDEETKKRVTAVLSAHIIYQEKPQKSFTDKAVDWLSSLMPDDDLDLSTPQ